MKTYDIQLVTDESEFFRQVMPLRTSLFRGTGEISESRFLSQKQTQRSLELGQRCGPNELKYLLLARHKEEIVGWCWSRQRDHLCLDLVNAAVIPEYRRNGIYTLLLSDLLGRVCEDGFQWIVTEHVISDNPIIIANLKQGFVVTGLRTDVRFGNLLELSFFFNDKMRKAYIGRSSNFNELVESYGVDAS